MPQCAADRIGPGDELAEDKTSVAELAELLPQRPPSEIINLLHLGVRACESWRVFHQPLPRLRVRHQIDDWLVLHRVEAGDVVEQDIGLYELRAARRCRRGNRRSHHDSLK